MSSGPWSSPDAMQRIADLRAQGLKWSAIAERLDRPLASLKIQYGTWRKGRRGTGWQRQARNRDMIRLAESGVPTNAIAAQLGLRTVVVCVTLARYGLDAEVRALYHEEPCIA